jgi:hypothetical protein
MEASLANARVPDRAGREFAFAARFLRANHVPAVNAVPVRHISPKLFG